MSDDPSERPKSQFPWLAASTPESTTLGSGWLSGLLSAILGIVGLGAVLCFRFPDVLTMPELRPHYPLPYLRATLHLVLVGAFSLGTLSIWMRRNKALGLTGISTTLLAALLGGAQVPLGGEVSSGPFLGLDWFLLNLIGYSAVYIPLERLFAKYPTQPTFRQAWRVDLTYFFINSLLVQLSTLLTMQPAMVFFDWARLPIVSSTIGQLTLWLQIPIVLLVADFTQYWVHRAFHSWPVLWRFHAIHHSAEAMDWLAGSRLHLVDAVLTRGLTYIPLYVLGFSEAAIAGYVVIVVFQATFIHANVRWEFARLSRILATPCFHHWHHSAEREAIDKNFAVHTPVWDWLFGTYYMPGRWPKEYGLAEGNQVPDTFALQFLFPFRRRDSRE